MRFVSLRRYGVSPWRLAGVGLVVASTTWLVVYYSAGGVLGGARTPVCLFLAALAFYVVVSTPRRLADRDRVSQAREAALMSSAVAALLEATGSRAKALILLRPRARSVAIPVKEAAREVLLGRKVGDAVGPAAGDLLSYSAAGSLRRLGFLGPRAADLGDEEVRGLASTAELGRETKLPMLMTACFFTPILLLFYAVFSHAYSWADLSELVALEFFILDAAFYFSATEGGRR